MSEITYGLIRQIKRLAARHIKGVDVDTEVLDAVARHWAGEGTNIDECSGAEVMRLVREAIEKGDWTGNAMWRGYVVGQAQIFGHALATALALASAIADKEAAMTEADGIDAAWRTRDGKAAALTAKAEPASDTPDDAMLTHSQIAERYGVPAERLRKRLDRWRGKHLDGWQQVTDRKTREAGYVYRMGSVRSIVKNLAKS